MRKLLFTTIGTTYDDNLICISDCSGHITCNYYRYTSSKANKEFV